MIFFCNYYWWYWGTFLSLSCLIIYFSQVIRWTNWSNILSFNIIYFVSIFEQNNITLSIYFHKHIVVCEQDSREELIHGREGEIAQILDAFLQQKQNFSTFVVSVDRLLCTKAEAILKCLTSCLTNKWRKPYSRTYGYVGSKIVITMVRSTQCCIRGYWETVIRISVQRHQWEDGAGLKIYR